jgi:hypothetical protein
LSFTPTFGNAPGFSSIMDSRLALPPAPSSVAPRIRFSSATVSGVKNSPGVAFFLSFWIIAAITCWCLSICSGVALSGRDGMVPSSF